MAKATHLGECQLCGHRQMLPGGKLAKHGYTKQWGFFHGTCPGSDHLPFEISCDLIESNADRVEAQAAALRATAAKRRASTDAGDVMINLYRAPTYSRKGGYYWARCEVRLDERGYSIQRLELNVTDARRQRHDIYGVHPFSLEGAVAHLNGDYAKSLEQEARHMDQYVAWCRERVANWKPGVLTPRKG